MAIRYSDNVNGSASNNGTSALTPKADPSQHTTTNGDVHYIKGTGVPYTLADNFLGWNLLGKSNLTIQKWPGYDKPVISHNSVNGGSTPRAWIFDGGGAYLVEDIIFEDCIGAAIYDSGDTGTSWIIRRVEMYRIGLGYDTTIGTGIGIGYTTPVDSVIMEDLHIEYCGNNCVYIQATDLSRCVNSYFLGPSQGGIGGDCFQTYGECALVEAINNRCINTVDAKQSIIHAGGTGGHSRFLLNHCTGPQGVLTRYQSLYSDNPCLIVGNRLETGRIAILIKGGGVISGNLILFRGSSTEAIYDENVVSGASYIVNNTIALADGVSNTAEAIDKKDNTTSYVHNNIITGSWAQGMLLHSSAATESHNYVYGATYFALNESFAQRTPGTGSSTNDPLLDASYRPTADSPCKGAGTFIPGAKHFGGVPMNAGAPDIGAHRYFAPREIATERTLRRVGA